MKFRHDSWTPDYRKPFGAQPIENKITLHVKSKDAIDVTLKTYFLKIETHYPMQKLTDSDWWEITLTLPKTTGILWYHFSFTLDNQRFFYGTQSDHLGGLGKIYEKPSPPSYQITLFDPKRKSPSWYKQGIMYQIFPDRFNRGSDFNIRNFPKDAILHPNWNDCPHYFKDENGNIEYWDFFGGTLLGIIEKLDYLKSLNVTILYLNPIFKARSNHRYDTGDYMTIDPILGAKDSFKHLALECKKRNISIILDGVFSHTGDDSIYFNRYNNYPTTGAYQSKNSPFYPWYHFIHYPHTYSCWWGVDALPNTNETHPEFQNFIYNNPDSVIRHWMNAGASGWRLDVADELPDSFIFNLKKAILDENSDSILIGEVWEDASRKTAYSELKTYFSGYELDAIMNYPFRDTFIDFMLGEKTAPQTTRIMMSLNEHYPSDQFMGNMNLIGSHDRQRIITILGEDYNSINHPDQKPYHLNSDQYALAIKRLKLLSLIQMTFPGVPCIYYGDEVGIEGFEDPYNRRTYPWGNEDLDLLNWYKKITNLRANYSVFQDGSWQPYEASDDLFIFDRKSKTECCLCLFNRNSKAVHLFHDSRHPHYIGVNLLTNETISLDPIVVAPLNGVIILLKPKKELSIL
jgi:4-alpha-glucanotransferase